MKFVCWRPIHGETEACGDEVEALNHEQGAEKAAELVHDYCDTKDSSWPLTFHVKSLDTCKVKKFLVEREAVPYFYASEIKT